jgi:zinc protease
MPARGLAGRAARGRTGAAPRLEHGFSEAELAEARANLLNGFREAALRAATRKSGALANELVGAASVGNVFTSPAQELALAESVLEAMTPEDAHRALVEAWEGDTRLIHISGNLPEVATDDLALATYNESRAVAVEAPAAAEASEFAYGSFGEPGTVTSRTEVEDLGITQLRLSNNVYVNLKPTDFEDNVIRLLARFGGGLLEAPADKPGLPLLAGSTFIAGGLQAHSADDLARIFAGKTVGVDFEVDNDAFTLSGTSNMLDLESQLDLMAAYLTAPGYRDEALRQARRSLPQLYIQLRNTPQGVMQDRVASYLASGDPRFGFPPEDAVMERDLGELREWLAAPLSGSRLELSLVGDFEVEAVIPPVAQDLRGPAGACGRQARLCGGPPRQLPTTPGRAPRHPLHERDTEGRRPDGLAHDRPVGHLAHASAIRPGCRHGRPPAHQGARGTRRRLRSAGLQLRQRHLRGLRRPGGPDDGRPVTRGRTRERRA